MAFQHGIIYNTEVAARPATNTGNTVIVLLGTAGKGPSTPTLCNSLEDVLKKFGAVTNDEFTIPKDAADIYKQATAPVVVINVVDPATDTTAVSNENVTFSANNKAKLANGYVTSVTLGTTVTCKAIFQGNNTITLPAGITAVTSVKSSNGATTYVSGTDYNVTSNVITNLLASIPAGAEVLITYTATLVSGTDFTVSADTGTLSRVTTGKIFKNATVVASYTRVSASSITASDIIGTNTGGTKTGAEQIADIPSTLNIDLGNGILIAPNWTHQLVVGGGYNTVINKLLNLANTCGTMVISDTPNTTKEDAITWKLNNISPRVIAVGLGWNKSTINGASVTRPSAALVAGLIAGLDNQAGGVALSPSNRVIKGIEALLKPVSFNISVFADEGSASDANYLNENGVCTIINSNGFRFWGNYTTSDLGDQSRFINVKRVIDYLGRIIPKSLVSFIDLNISTGYLDVVTEHLNAEINKLIGQGILLSGEAWPASADINTPAELLAGNVYFNIRVSIASPAQTINITTRVTNGYLTSFTEAIV